MAKILFANLPAHGHVNPTLPLVSAFVKAGHSVDYLITENFRKKVEYCGATCIPYYKPFVFSGGLKLKNFWSFRKISKALHTTIKESASGYDAIIISNVLPMIPQLKKEIEIPIISCSATFLLNKQTLAHLFQIAKGVPSIVTFINKHRTCRRAFTRLFSFLMLGFGRKDLSSIMSPQSSVLNIVFTSRYYQPYEKDFDDKCLFIGPTPTISVKDSRFPIHKLEHTDRKIIYATLGTVFNIWTEFFKTIIKAFQDSDYLVVMSTGSKERVKEIGEVPGNFIVRDFVPQAEVLKHADLFIAHGGMGSVSDGITMGKPMILVPLGADQFFNAYRLQELGAGKVLTKADFTVENIRREVRLILKNKNFGPQAIKLQESFRSAGGPELGVRKVEEVLEKRKNAKG